MTYPIPASADIHKTARPELGASTGAKTNIQKWNEKESVSFWDFVDVINPLQHIPVVSMIYRGLTGDTIAPMARVAGGALFGGFIGAALGTVNVVSELRTGADIGENVMNKMDIQLTDMTKKKPQHEVLPVVEVRPVASARPQAPVIYWDDEKQPVQLASNTPAKQKIYWDDEQASHFAAVTPSAGHPARQHKIMPAFDSAFDVPDVMPSAKNLNDLEPGMKEKTSVAEKTMPPEVIVPQAMMDALSKYEKMQKSTNAGLIQPDPLKAAIQKKDPQALPELAAKQVASIAASPMNSVKPEMTVATPPAFSNFRRFR